MTRNNKLQQLSGPRGSVTFLQCKDPSLPALTVGCEHVEDVVIMDNLERGIKMGASH